MVPVRFRFGTGSAVIAVHVGPQLSLQSCFCVWCRTSTVLSVLAHVIAAATRRTCCILRTGISLISIIDLTTITAEHNKSDPNLMYKHRGMHDFLVPWPPVIVRYRCCRRSISIRDEVGRFHPSHPVSYQDTFARSTQMTPLIATRAACSQATLVCQRRQI